MRRVEILKENVEGVKMKNYFTVIKSSQDPQLLNSPSVSPCTSISSSSPINPGNENDFYQPNESQSFNPSYKYPMNYFTQLHHYPHFELFQHSRLFYPPIGDFNGKCAIYLKRKS